jgi:hypothetical protein
VTDEMVAAGRSAQTLLQALVERAQAAGGIRSDVNGIDVARLIELFSRSHAASDDDDEQVQQRLLALALDGLRATGAGPLPGDPPSAASHAARWRQSPAGAVG